MSALLVLMLSACSIPQDSEIDRACRVMGDRTPHLAGVKKSSFAVTVHSHSATCSGVVELQQELASTDVGRIVEGTYDSVRDADADSVRITTRFTAGSTTLVVVTGGFPKAAETTALVDVAAEANATYLYMGVGSSDRVFGQVGVRLSSTAPAESLDEALGFLRNPLPRGVYGLSWGFNDSQIFVEDGADTAELAALASAASWFARHPGISRFELSSQSHLDKWTLTTLVEAPELVGEFTAIAADCGHPLAVEALLQGEKPYLSLP